MQELEQLKAMWSSNIKRTTTLIVSKISYTDKKGSLNNEDWGFVVPYAVRDSLDIKYEQRKKNKKSYIVWTQGPILSFMEGDTFTSKDKTKAIQVQFSNPMGWDASKDSMYQGSVTFDIFDICDEKYTKINQHSCNQMQLLETLISGVIKPQKN